MFPHADASGSTDDILSDSNVDPVRLMVLEALRRELKRASRVNVPTNVPQQAAVHLRDTIQDVECTQMATVCSNGGAGHRVHAAP